jgi:hypothetical protein
MTDYSELIKNMRDSETRYVFGPAAADALEAQAKRIAEKDARIAELEAAVEFWKEQRNRTFDMCMGGLGASAYANASIKALEKKDD